MARFSLKFPLDFKSPGRILARVFWRSRENFKCQAKQQAEELKLLKARLAAAERKCEVLGAEVTLWKSQYAARQASQDQAPDWAHERPLPGHQFSLRMMALCCQLCLIVGFQATPKVLKRVSEAFHLQLQIPSHDAVRNWTFRNGVALLQEPTRATDWIWMIDHSVQLGKQFVLVVLGIRSVDVPPGRALKREDMRVLAVLPTASRTKAEVSKQLGQVAEKLGSPLAVVSDGASELRAGVASLTDADCQGICLSDVKHKIASLLKRKLGREASWKAFENHLGATSAALQQTELDHFLPPRKKLKCRFMNFDRVIDWACKTLEHLQQTPSSTRLREKLGWLKTYTAELQQWQQVRALMGNVLRQANTQGVWVGATAQLRQELLSLPATSDWVVTLREGLLEIVSANEAQLNKLSRKGLRLPCSTEVLESAFGSFKALQRNHNRGTFTALLATFPALFETCTPEKLRRRLPRVNNRVLKEWITTNGLSNSTQSRRMQLQAAHRKLRRKTEKNST